MCRIWAKRLDGKNHGQWFSMPYGPRSYEGCLSIVDYYEEEWPNAYLYEITADNNLCRPLS